MQTKKYFHNRNKYLNAFVNRYILGRREIDTMGALLKYCFSYDIASTKVFLDIGCGDKFLQLPIEEHGITYIGVDIDQCNFESDKLKAWRKASTIHKSFGELDRSSSKTETFEIVLNGRNVAGAGASISNINGKYSLPENCIIIDYAELIGLGSSD